MRERTLLFGAVVAVILGIFAFYVADSGSAPVPQAQANSPIDELQLHLVGVHVIKEAPDRQFVAHHYCQQLDDGVIQCAVFDSDGPGARLMGTEYVVSDDVYLSLSAEEQQYWHPHTYEVDGGLLAAPELPPDQEEALLNTIRSTHGRTWNVWATGEDSLPVGKPDLAWSITGPGQLREDIEQELQQELR